MQDDNESEITTEPAIAADAPTVAVGDKVRYTAVEGHAVNVVAFVLAVHDDNTIDLGWRGDLGWVHPDQLAMPHLERHVRERVPATNWERMA